MRTCWLVVAGAMGCGSSQSSSGSCSPGPFQGQSTAIGTASLVDVALPQSLAFAISSMPDGSLDEQTPLGGTATAIAAFAPTATLGWDHPALRPDGNELFARELNSSTIWSSTFAQGAWAAPTQVSGPFPSDGLASTPAAVGTSGDLHMMIWDDTTLQEFARTAGTWSAVGPVLSPTDLIGEDSMLAAPQLTPDGLSLVFLAGNASTKVYFSHRASIDADFPLPATAILSPSELIYSPYLTENCRDLYLVDDDGVSGGHLARFGP